MKYAGGKPATGRLCRAGLKIEGGRPASRLPAHARKPFGSRTGAQFPVICTMTHSLIARLGDRLGTRACRPTAPTARREARSSARQLCRPPDRRGASVRHRSPRPPVRHDARRACARPRDRARAASGPFRPARREPPRPPRNASLQARRAGSPIAAPREALAIARSRSRNSSRFPCCGARVSRGSFSLNPTAAPSRTARRT